jgi:hypothetical protein
VTFNDNRTWYSKLAKTASRFSGKPRVFSVAVAIIVVWAISGPFFGFSDTWQLAEAARRGGGDTGSPEPSVRLQ